MRCANCHTLQSPFSLRMKQGAVCNASLTLELSVEQGQCVTPEVRWYKENDCIVFQGCCPLVVHPPLEGKWNAEEGATQLQELTGTPVPFTPTVLWSVVPSYIDNILREASTKVKTMDPGKLPPGVTKLPTGSKFREEHTQQEPNIATEGTVNINVSAESKVPEILKTKQELEREVKIELFTVNKNRPAITYPVTSTKENKKEDSSSDDSIPTRNAFVQRKLQATSNASEAKEKPVSDNISHDSSSDLSDEPPKRKWERRGAICESLPLGVSAKESTESTVVGVYSSHVPPIKLQREQPSELRGEQPPEEDSESVSVNISEKASGEIQVDVNKEEVENGPEVVLNEYPMQYQPEKLKRASMDYDPKTLRMMYSKCPLCGSRLRDKKKLETNTQIGDKISGVDADLTLQTGVQKMEEKKKERDPEEHLETFAADRILGEGSEFTDLVDMQKKEEERKGRDSDQSKIFPGASSIQAHTATLMTDHHLGAKQGITPLTVGQKKKEDRKGKYSKRPNILVGTHSICAHPVTLVAGSKKDKTAEQRRVSSGKKTFSENPSIAVFAVSPLKSLRLPTGDKTKIEESSSCSVAPVPIPRDACPYSPSLSSLPLNESDIQFIIHRAKLAKSALPSDGWACPFERWQVPRKKTS